MDNKYIHILHTDNYDKHMEFWWLTFKDSMINFYNTVNNTNINNKDEIKKVKQLSNELNILQNEKKYKQIYEYIYLSIQNYGWIQIKYGNHISIHFFTTNLHRWDKIKSELNNTFKNDKKYKLLKCYSLIKKKAIQYVEKNKNFITIIDEIKKCSINDMEYNLNLLYTILHISIKKKLISIIEEINTIINVNTYINTHFIINIKNLSIKKIFHSNFIELIPK